jgi:hypothetical protein
MDLFANPLEVTLKYSLSNLLSLFIGGLFFIPPLVAYIVILLAAEAFSNNTYLMLALFGLVLLLFLLCIAVPGGYIIRCLRDRRAGSLRMPDFFAEPVRLLGDSAAFLVMMIAYVICFIILFGILMVPLVLLPLTSSGMAFLFAFDFMLVFIAVFAIAANVLFFTFFLSLAEYAASGSLLSALNPLRLAKVIAANPLAFLVTLILVYGAASILQILMMLIVTMPWVIFFILLIDALVVADVCLAAERKAAV